MHQRQCTHGSAQPGARNTQRSAPRFAQAPKGVHLGVCAPRAACAGGSAHTQVTHALVRKAPKPASLVEFVAMIQRIGFNLPRSDTTIMERFEGMVMVQMAIKNRPLKI